MRRWVVMVLAMMTAGAAAAQTAPPQQQPLLTQIAADVSADRQHATIERLVGFGTRHTLSDTRSNRRGIGAARRWVQSEFEAMSRACSGCLTIATPSQTVSGTPRIPNPTEIVDVLAIQRGTTDPDRVIVISGHLDSRVRDVMDFTSNAPGANDDGSGTAAVIEAARVLSRHRFRATLVYAVLSGEEQGLNGGKVLADYARAQGWFVEAALNNDIVGNTEGMDGQRNRGHVRVFSEGTRATETPQEADRRRYNGGEVDSPSRNLARFMDSLAERYIPALDVTMVYRTDRFGRGGDQVRMLEAGYPAVRVTEAVENYNRQHQDLRTENGVRYGDTIDGVDFPYLANVTRLNAVTMAALAMAPAPPSGVMIAGQVTADTHISWRAVEGATSYRVWRRSTTAPQWTDSTSAANATELTLPGVVIDDWFFGVSAVSDDGYESPVVFPGAAGAFDAPPPGPPPPRPPPPPR